MSEARVVVEKVERGCMDVVDAGVALADPDAAPAPQERVGRSRPSAGPVQKVIPGALLVPIERVERDPMQPRRDWKHSAGMQRLEELTQSVREFGLLQPLLVRQEGDRYIVIAGGRRLVAARRAGMTEVPVVVHNAEGATVRILQLLENLQRQELSPTDEARAYQELMELEGLTPPKIALRVRRHEQHVRDRLRLLRDQVLSDAVERRQISATVAREINKLPDEIAETLRRQVQNGARLQQKDIDEARAHMARDGVVHPRLAPRADRRTRSELGDDAALPCAGQVERPLAVPDVTARPEGPSTPPASAALATPVWIDVDQHRTVRSDKEALDHLQQDYQRLRASMLPSYTPPPSWGPTSPGQAGTTATHPQENPLSQAVAPTGARASLAELIVGLDLLRLRQLLLYGIERGMSCAGLWQHIHELGGPTR